MRVEPEGLGMKYAVVIDAGSSGSRSFVYMWPDPVKYVDEVRGESGKLDALLPVQTQPLWTYKRQPGISTFAGRTREIWAQHLEPLLKTALEVVPVELQSETPVYFLATAGMRLLPETDQTEILQTVCSLLQSKTSFLVPECESHVSVIDGETEALYGWLGLNYLVHNSLTMQWNNFENTYGFLDMGGASSQLAFAVVSDSPEGQKHKEDLQKLRIRTAGGDPVEWSMFVTSWLGFGANQARQRLFDQLVGEITPDIVQKYEENNAPVPALDPCMPHGAVETVEISGHNYVFQGSGDFAACEDRAFKLLNAGVPCPDEPCLFDGKHAPDFDLEDRKFVGISEYWYTLQDMLGTNGKFDRETLIPQIHGLCNGEWKEISDRLHKQEILKSNGQPFVEDDIRKTCFKSAWVLTILNRGFNFSLSPENAQVDHRFQDTFQSAMEIGGTEISWTTGRAVLYASSQIPTMQDSADVGFLNLKGEFIPGGERLPLAEIHRFQGARAGWSTGSILFLWTLVLMLIALGIARRVQGSFAEVWDSLLEIRIIKKLRRKMRHWQSSHIYTTSNMGYGYSFPHAEYPLTDFYNEGISSSRSMSQTPSRVGSRANLSDAF